MKILLVITKAEIGGAQVFVLNLAKYLVKAGHSVHIVSGEGKFLPAELQKLNIPFFKFKSLKRDYNILNSLSFINKLHRLISENHYDIIHLNSTNTLIGVLSTFFLLKPPKIVFTIHGLSFLDQNYAKNIFLESFTKLYFKILLLFVDRNVFVSQKNFEELDKLSKSNVILNGLNYSEMFFNTREDARNFFSDKTQVNLTDAFIIGSTGRLSYQKNYDFLLSNYHILKDTIPNLKIIIIGDGPNVLKYKRWIIETNLQYDILFVGEIKDSYKFIKAFDVFTLTSKYEGLSISLIEALFAATPILASNVGGNPEVVDFDERQLFNLDDADDYVTKLLEIIKNKESIESHNRKLKDKFSIQRMTDSYIKIYKELIHI